MCEQEILTFILEFEFILNWRKLCHFPLLGLQSPSNCLWLPLWFLILSAGFRIHQLYAFTKPFAWAGGDIGSVFKWSFNRFWIQRFPSRSVVIPRIKNSVCPTFLPITGRRIVGFIPFPRVLALCEMLIASPRIWTW